MSRLSISMSVVAAALLAAMTGTPVAADTWDKLAFMTFSGPVQVPGGTLGAGTYRFHLMNPESSRNVLQVLSNDGKTVYSMFQTLPDYRTKVTFEPTVTFREVPAGVAPPVQALFYPGENHGYAFVYPRGEPIMVPAVTPQPPISYTPNPAAPAPIAVEPAAAAAAAPPAAATEPLAAEPVTEPAAPTASSAPALPATASPLPSFALGGVVLLALGVGLGLLRRRVA